MAEVDTRDLRLLAVGMLKWCSRRWPEVVRQDDVDRVQSATNVLLVGLRVCGGILTRLGMSFDELSKIADSAVHRPKARDAYSTMMATVEPDEVIITTGRMDPMLAMADVDRCLVDPECSSRVRPWFRDDFYPAVVRRAARNKWPNHREIEVMLAEVSHMRGDR